MNRGCLAAAILITLVYALPVGAQTGPSDYLHHSLVVSLEPSQRSIEATDSIYVSAEEIRDGKIVFLLNRSLSVASVTSPHEFRWGTEDQLNPADFKANPDSEDAKLVGRSQAVWVEFAGSPAGGGPAAGSRIPIVISFSGVIYDSLTPPAKTYAKGFETTSGLIEERGVYLANESVWYPYRFDEMFTFRLEAEVPSGWMTVSQGGLAGGYREGAADRHLDVWVEPNPTPDIYLVAGRYARHEETFGDTRIMTYTYEPSDSLSSVYIDAARRYIGMYDGMIGQYPYPKFALVENFWQTGYGMPSFTLLGNRVIRLPFIVSTSYGHEILHNWWGNSVYVDYDTGNWCEGLTTYGADYLYKETAGADQALEYRHNTLIAFHNYVTERKDFPLSTFLERSDAATQSVGYGKSLMVFHMLSRTLGKGVFWDCLRSFYARFKFRMASWSDLEAVFSEEAGQDLSWFFDQWVDRTGAPTVELLAPEVVKTGDVKAVRFTLRQSEPAYTLDLPVRVGTVHGDQDFVVRLRGRDSTYALEMRSLPTSLAIDPDFDLFRHLYIEEIPVTLSSLFAQESIPVVMGGGEDEAAKAAFRDLAREWDLSETTVDESDPDQAAAIESGVAQTHVWLMGRGEALDRLLAATSDITIRGDDLVIADSTYSLAGRTFVCALRNPANSELSAGIVLSRDASALRALASKLPHYASYSYLLFEKDRPLVKGIWKRGESPLTVNLREVKP